MGASGFMFKVLIILSSSGSLLSYRVSSDDSLGKINIDGKFPKMVSSTLQLNDS